MGAYDCKGIRHVFQHIGVDDPKVMETLYEKYKRETSDNSMSLNTWLHEHLISDEILDALLSGRAVKKAFADREITTDDSRHEKLKQYFYADMPMYVKFIMQGIIEETFTEFLTRFLDWLYR